MSDLENILKDTKGRMKKAVDFLGQDYKTLRTGRANVALLDGIFVDYYGQKTPLNQVGNVSAPDAHTILISPWDKSAIPLIEKAIETSDLGLNPSNDGSVVRLPIPQLTEERRKEITKIAKKKAEDAKVSIRNIRRDSNDSIKKAEKDGHVSEDEVKKYLDKVQKETDSFIKDIDSVYVKKEKEILEV